MVNLYKEAALCKIHILKNLLALLTACFCWYLAWRDGGSKFLQSVGEFLLDYLLLYPRLFIISSLT
jgi:hypothetical protein